MGTAVTIAIDAGDLDAAASRHAIEEACAVLHAADRVFSTYRPDSAISRMRRGELALSDAPPEVADVLDICHVVGRLTGGWFDAWGDSEGVDPTGVVKGWAVQRAAEVLRAAGVVDGSVNGGGDIQVLGVPQRIGVRSPDRADRLACVVEVDGAIATSGTYERGDHIRGEGGAVLAATVIGPDLTLADPLATALFAEGVDGLERIERIADYEAVVIDLDGHLRPTTGFRLAAPRDQARMEMSPGTSS